MLQFIFDRLVDRENICNLKREQALLAAGVSNTDRMVLYAPRNYGKTSVVRNVIAQDFQAAHHRSFVFFADLLGVHSMESLNRRLAAALERSFEQTFPVKRLVQEASRFLSSLRPQINVDPDTGAPGLSLQIESRNPQPAFSELWRRISAIATEVPSLVILDEFQDVSIVEEAPALMRGVLEALPDAPVLLLGSKRHMLSALFAAPEAPLAGWGTDIEFSPIAYETYHAYIQERFVPADLTIDLAAATYLQDQMHRVPEAINRVCRQLLDLYSGTEVDREMITRAIVELIDGRSSRFEAYLAPFTDAEQRIIIAVAQRSSVTQPTAKAFLAAVELSARAAANAVRRLADRGVLEAGDDGYRLTDPLLAGYVRRHR